MLREGEDIRALAEPKLAMPALAVGGGSGNFTASIFSQVASDLTSTTFDDIGHYVAMEAPELLADTLLGFYQSIDDKR